MSRYLLATAIVLVISCKDDPAGSGSLTAVAVRFESSGVTLEVGGTANVSVTAITSDGTPALCGVGTGWTSNNPAIATVATPGAAYSPAIVTGVAAGGAILTFSCAPATGGIAVTVTAPVAANLTITGEPSAAMSPGDVVQLAAKLTSANNVVVAGTVTWRSSNAAVATVDGNGKVTAVSSGEVSITASSGSLFASVDISVLVPVVGDLIGPAGGSATSADGEVHLVFPAGALGQNAYINIVPVNNGFPGNSNLLPGVPVYQITTTPASVTLLLPITGSITYPFAGQPSSVPEFFDSFGTGTGGSWSSAPGSTDNATTHTASAPLATLPTFVGALFPPGFPVTSDFTDGDPSSTAGAAASAVTICVGQNYEEQFSAGNFTATSSNSAIVTVFGSLQGYLEMTGVSPGTARAFFTEMGITASMGVTVTACPRALPLAAATYSATTDNIVYFQGGALQSVPGNGADNYPGIGVFSQTGGGVGAGARLMAQSDVTPMAYRVANGASYTETVYWTGLSGAATAVVPPANSSNFAAAFVDNGPFLFAPNVNGVAEIWGVPLGGSTATKMTNLGGSMLYLATSPDGNVYFDWAAPGVGAIRHIYRLAVPTIGGAQPTSGQVQVTPTTTGASETQPAVSQNGRLVAYAVTDGSTYSKIYLLDVGKTGSSPVLVSPASGFSYIPAFCGNGSVYFAYSSSFSGTYTVYKGDVASGTSAQVAALAGTPVANMAIARGDGDGGLHSCP